MKLVKPSSPPWLPPVQSTSSLISADRYLLGTPDLSARDRSRRLRAWFKGQRDRVFLHYYLSPPILPTRRRSRQFSFEKIQTKNPLWVDRITAAVSSALTAKGLTQVPSGGDISVVAMEMTRDHQTLNTFYDDFGGGWGWRWGGGGFGQATTTTDTYRLGTLVIDLFDANSKQLIWRGSESNALSNKSSKNIQSLDKSVDKLFREYPPKA